MLIKCLARSSLRLLRSVFIASVNLASSAAKCGSHTLINSNVAVGFSTAVIQWWAASGLYSYAAVTASLTDDRHRWNPGGDGNAGGVMLLALDFLESEFLSGALPGGSWGSGSGPPGGPPHLLLPFDGILSLAGGPGSLEFGGFLNLLIPAGCAPAGGIPIGCATGGVTGSDVRLGTELSPIIWWHLSRNSWSAKISSSLAYHLALNLALAICYSSWALRDNTANCACMLCFSSRCWASMEALFLTASCIVAFVSFPMDRNSFACSSCISNIFPANTSPTALFANSTLRL